MDANRENPLDGPCPQTPLSDPDNEIKSLLHCFIHVG